MKVIIYSLKDPGTKVTICEVASKTDGKRVMRLLKDPGNWHIERRPDLDTFDDVVLAIVN